MADNGDLELFINIIAKSVKQELNVVTNDVELEKRNSTKIRFSLNRPNFGTFFWEWPLLEHCFILNYK